jgi:hypothetical protein
MTNDIQTPALDAEPTIPVSTPAIDMKDVMTWIAEEKQRRDARNAKDRVALHVHLMEQGVMRVDAQYDAYCDSGNVESITLTPDTSTIEEARERALGDFIWSMAYALHPGFENNDGGDGEFVWDVTEDKISIDHRERFTDYNHYSHEDL